jgi:hypothetical protein
MDRCHAARGVKGAGGLSPRELDLVEPKPDRRKGRPLKKLLASMGGLELSSSLQWSSCFTEPGDFHEETSSCRDCALVRVSNCPSGKHGGNAFGLQAMGECSTRTGGHQGASGRGPSALLGCLRSDSIRGHADEPGQIQSLDGVCSRERGEAQPLIAIFVRYAERDPSRWHEDSIATVIESLQAAFPCTVRK